MPTLHVLIVKKCKNIVKGRISLFMNKIDACTYIGYLNPKQRDNIMQFISRYSPQTKLILIYDAPNTIQNYKIDIIGYTHKQIHHLDDSISFIKTIKK